jgi:hypothetical protein
MLSRSLEEGAVAISVVVPGPLRKRMENVGAAILKGLVMSVRFENFSVIRTCRREILGCALVESLGILVLVALNFRYGTYYSDGIAVLYPVTVHSLTESFRVSFRPLEYLILLAANNVYLPLWFGASLLSMVGATILAGLACERLFERQLPKVGWWILGLANPLLFLPISQAQALSQPLANLLFAGAMLAFISELHRLRDQPLVGWRADCVAVFLNLIAAALFLTKENAVAAATVIPAATAWIRLKASRLSPIFLFSLLLPIGAAICWIFLKILFKSEYPTVIFPSLGNTRYDLKVNPIAWGQNFIATLAFPVTPLPSSFIGFELLRPLWVVVALGSVTLFIELLLRESLRQPKIVLPLLVIAASCAPMILIHASELYSSMIAPFAVSIVLLFGLSKMRRLSLAYGLLLYAASLVNGVIFCLGSDFNLLGLQHLQYSIYTKEFQTGPICPIRTAHIGWDGADVRDLLGEPGVKGWFTCIP